MVGSRYLAWPPASVNTPMKQFFLFLLIGLVLVFAQSIPWNYIVPRMVALNLSFVFVIFLALYCPSIGSLLIAFLLVSHSFSSELQAGSFCLKACFLRPFLSFC